MYGVFKNVAFSLYSMIVDYQHRNEIEIKKMNIVLSLSISVFSGKLARKIIFFQLY